MDSLQQQSSIVIAVLIANFICLPIIYYVSWLLFFDPLRHIPGPWYTRISSIWVSVQCRFGKKSVEIHKLHQKYGDVVQISSNHVSINKPEAMQEIYVRDRVYPKGPWYLPSVTKEPPLFATYDADEHIEQRKNLNPAFSTRALRDFEPLMSGSHLLFMRLLNGLFNGRNEIKVDLNQSIHWLSFDIISDFSFGKKFGFLDKGYDFLNLVQAMDERIKGSNAIGNLPTWIKPLINYIPDPFWRAGALQILRIRKLVEQSYEERLASGNFERKDLISYMLEAKSEGGESLPKGRILSQSTAMIVAGSDSTAASTVHFVDKVSRDLALQERVRAEIEAAFPGKPGDDWVPSDAEVTKLTYTKAVLYEVLRLTPTMALGLERVVTRPGTNFGGYELPPGTLISVPVYSTHRNAVIYPDPEDFEPDRWLQHDSSEQYRHFSIFSTGPRSCIGQNIAWMEMLKTICLLIKYYQMERATTQPTQYFDGMFLEAEECNVKLTKRY